MNIYLIAIALLVILAVFDLIVGVSNDAVNFLNSSFGSKVASKKVIMIIGSLGIFTGVTFSSGMMEVARKGIFQPALFSMHELIVLFLAVMLTDVLLLDFFNTHGLPTSTTVSIVFELLGAAVVVSFLKIIAKKDSLGMLMDYINTAKALAIILGILLSVVIAFAVGSIVQFFSRLLFTFDYKKNMKFLGSLWGAFAMSAITYFVIVKGAKGISFLTKAQYLYIKNNKGQIVLVSLFCYLLLFLFLNYLTRVNILKIVILAGTFSLALAFAANDLVNFIGVPLAGLNAYDAALSNGVLNPLMGMSALQGKVPSNTLFLLIAGLVMVITLWLSKKSRTVSKTELSLGRQDEGVEKFESSAISRIIVRMFTSVSQPLLKLMPKSFLSWVDKRFSRVKVTGDGSSFDMVRASVNIMVAGILISLGTSLELPLSTTYVTFMVSMGSSFADRAWGRDSAVYRVSGVITVIGGWFMTAIIAFIVSGAFSFLIFKFKILGAIGIIFGIAFVMINNKALHRKKEKEDEDINIFNLQKITNRDNSLKIIYHQSSILMEELRKQLVNCKEGLFSENRYKLKECREKTKVLFRWSNIIIANTFKVLRLQFKQNTRGIQEYSAIISTLRDIAESHRDFIVRAYNHINNNHKGLLEVQKQEIDNMVEMTNEILLKASYMFANPQHIDEKEIAKLLDQLITIIGESDKKQISRIQDESSKTRLSILFYSLASNCKKICSATYSLVALYHKV